MSGSDLRVASKFGCALESLNVNNRFLILSHLADSHLETPVFKTHHS